MVCGYRLGELFFELIDIATDATHPASIKAVFDIFPLAAGEVGDAEGDKSVGVRRHRFQVGIY